MANNSQTINNHRKTIGDIAVDGLLAGMAAGVVMALWLILVGLLGGEGPAATLGRFDPGAGGLPAIGALMHLAVAGIYGVIFALVVQALSGRWSLSPKPALYLVGVAYGLLLWLVARLVVLPDLNQTLGDITALNFLAAHILYGVALGYLLGRHQTG